ncbi:uncharacterized protein LOC135466035 isoform X2 [Liolophura sinensis]|uniref:uncharacterized protein LOC135466035 isoform X2 n=1 Tax=Liolophura sinensis TaxID=3198878 RepID=UPI003158C8E0
MDSWLVVASTTWMRTIHPQGPSDLPEPFSLGQTITWPMRCQVTPPNMSTDTVYDNMDLAAKSRGKDKRLMSQVNAALNPESVPKGSKESKGLHGLPNQRLLQRYFPESAHDYHPILTLRETDMQSPLSSLPEYRKHPIPPVYKPPRLTFDEPSRKVGGGGSMRQWLADGLSKTRTMFRKDGEEPSEFRWLDAPSMGELDSPEESLYSDTNDISFSDPYSSYDLPGPLGSDRQSPFTSMYEDVEPDDVDSSSYFMPAASFGRRKLRAITPKRPLHSVQQLRRRRRRRERNRTPSYMRQFPLSDDVSDTSSDIGSDILDDYPLSLDSIKRQSEFLPYEPAPPYPTTKIFSDYGTSLPSLQRVGLTPTPRLPELSTSRVMPSALWLNDLVSSTRRRALASIPGPSDLDTSNVIFSIDTPLSYRPRTSRPRRLEFEVPVVFPSPLRSTASVTSSGNDIAPFRPIKPLVIETNRNALDLSKPIVVTVDGRDDFFSKFLSQRKQFRDSILKRLDDETDRCRSVVPVRSTSSYYTAPYRAILTSRRSPEPQSTHRDRGKRTVDTHDDLLPLPRVSRTTYPVRAVVSVSSNRDPFPRYSSYERVRPTENDDDSMSLVPVSRSNPSRTYSCERDSEEPTGTLTTLDRIRMKAAIISPNVEIETKRKKGPKSKYAAAVMRELRLNPKQRQIIYT